MKRVDGRTTKRTFRLLYVLMVRLLPALAVILFVVTVAPASAQQGSFRRSGSPPWTAGNRMSRTSQVPPKVANGAIETKNHDVRYKVVPIGVLPGKTTTYLSAARGLNNIGHVTGYSYVYTAGDPLSEYLTSQGFIWQNGKLKALPLLSGWPGAWAFGINDRDQVIGNANKLDERGRLLITAVLWDHGQPVNLGTLQPNSFSFAFDVNIWGVIVGSSYSFDTNLDLPVVWYGGAVHQLPLLPGEDSGFAEEINALGVISGGQTQDGTSGIPCIWYWNGSGYTPVNLGSFGGDYGVAFGINNLTQAVGYSLYPGDLHGPGFLWDYQHGLQVLPLLPGDTDATIYNINDFGQIVGDSQVFDNNGSFVSQRAAIWEKGTVTDLQTLVPLGTPPLTYESGDINGLGEITVNAANPDGSPLGLLLVPINKH